MRLYMANRAFDFWHTPGHALHHLVIHDRLTDSLFTGDTFGVSYRELDVDGRPFIFPTTSPSQFDPQQLKDSVRRIAALSPQAAYLTHYGRITGIAKLAEQLLTQIDQLVGFAHELATSPEPHKALNTAIFDWLNTALDRHGFPADAALRHHLLDSDVELNTQGLLSWLARQRNEAKLNQ
jgi:glyoxylase-like metal-dependent hydrolase (beta-lactamase superfamily II)